MRILTVVLLAMVAPMYAEKPMRAGDRYEEYTAFQFTGSRQYREVRYRWLRKDSSAVATNNMTSSTC